MRVPASQVSEARQSVPFSSSVFHSLSAIIREVDFRLTEEQQLLRRTVREFAEAEIGPHVRKWDEAQHFPAELIPRLAELGLLGIQWPEEYGGAGMSAVDYCICIEELARVAPGGGLSGGAHHGRGPG